MSSGPHHVPMLMPSYGRRPLQVAPFKRRLTGNDIDLTIRQQPREALQVTPGREKHRKTVDPPPIVEILVSPDADPGQHFLQSPYLFMNVMLYKPDVDEPVANWSKAMMGNLGSSLHRLKDVTNRETGFFVFGDISVNLCGNFRLRWELFDLYPNERSVLHLKGITSEIFRVIPPKEFKGMWESTYISRSLVDQGVRLRLRKEPRGAAGSKRGYQEFNDVPGVDQDHWPDSQTPPERQTPANPAIRSVHETLSPSISSLQSAYQPSMYLNVGTIAPLPNGHRANRLPTQRLRHNANTNSTGVHFPPPLDPSSDLHFDSSFRQADQAPNPDFWREQFPPPSLSRGSTSLPNYSPAANATISRGQQPLTAPSVPRFLPQVHHGSSPSTSLPSQSSVALHRSRSLLEFGGSSHQPPEPAVGGTSQFSNTAALYQPQTYGHASQLGLQSSNTYQMPSSFGNPQQSLDNVEEPLQPYTSTTA